MTYKTLRWWQNRILTFTNQLSIQKMEKHHFIWLLATNNEKSTPLHIAYATSDVEVAKLLLERGANIEALNSDNESPLYYALKKEENDIFELSLGKALELVNEIVEPCTVNIRDENELIHLHWAVSNKNTA